MPPEIARTLLRTLEVYRRQTRDALTADEHAGVTRWLYVVDRLAGNAPRVFPLRLRKAAHFLVQAEAWKALAEVESVQPVRDAEA